MIRMPEELRALDPKVRERLGQRLERGKIDCGIRYKPSASAQGELSLNLPLADQLIAMSAILGKRMDGAAPLATADILGWPSVVETQEQDISPVQNEALDLLELALNELIATREREGGRLAEIILSRCVAMRDQVALAKQRMPQVIADMRERLVNRLMEVSRELDRDRLEQEMAILAQKMDVDEEMDRLTTHLDEVERVVNKGGAVGRRLDFLMQELNREANTLGSKSADSETTAVSVEMKVLIEQMREQVQNIE